MKLKKCYINHLFANWSFKDAKKICLERELIFGLCPDVKDTVHWNTRIFPSRLLRGVYVFKKLLR